MSSLMFVGSNLNFSKFWEKASAYSPIKQVGYYQSLKRKSTIIQGESKFINKLENVLMMYFQLFMDRGKVLKNNLKFMWKYQQKLHSQISEVCVCKYICVSLSGYS